MSELDDLLDKHAVDERFVSYRELHRIAMLARQEIERLRAELKTETARVNAAIGDAAETFIAERQRDEAIEAALWLWSEAKGWCSEGCTFAELRGDEALERWPWLREVEDE